MLFRRNMISTKLGNMECAKPTNTAAPPVQLRSPQYAANLRRLKRGGLLLCSSRPPNWSQHNFEYYGQQLRPSHPLIEGRLIVFDEMGLEICSSVLGQTRPTTLYQSPRLYLEPFKTLLLDTYPTIHPQDLKINIQHFPFQGGTAEEDIFQVSSST